MTKDYAGETLTLQALATLLRKFVAKGKMMTFDIEKQRIISLYDRIIKAALRYDTKNLVSAQDFFSLTDAQQPWQPLVVLGEKTIEELRQQDDLDGASHDPLYRDILLGKQLPGILEIDWVKVLKLEIDRVKRENTRSKIQPIPAYTDISSGKFACAKCQGRNGLCVEAMAPFRIFCNEQCRSLY
jgi:hypothetical protein